MTEHAAFLQAILAAPDDDGPRLVYADWLEEHGDPRGEFIRVQCELARLGDDGLPVAHAAVMNRPCGCHLCSLRARERQLFEQDHRTHGWFGPALRLTRAGDDWWALLNWFRRGFVESVTCTAADWLEHGPAVVAAQPVRRVTLSDMDPAGPIVGGPEAGRWFFPLRDVPLEWRAHIEFAQVGRGVFTSTKPSREEVTAALSDAALAWARSITPAGAPL